ncbi:sensor histidine kinase [Hyalangium versicolor]|uniref:sensor histidine kinase n=1 Tax=Hyalangium versicolor TaxID=2861190 RepID=UPI001CCA31BE|nr:HAMP domain-containing sensor histidine kinase [Hyalangium versicolor]
MEQKRWLISTPFIVLALVIGSFVTSTAYLGHYSHKLGATALTIVRTTIPTLQPLTEMRLEIHRIVTMGQSEGPGISHDARLSIVRNAQRRFNEAFRKYSELPRQPGDGEISAAMAPAVDQLNRQVDTLLAKTQTDLQEPLSEEALEPLRDAAETMTGLLMQEMSLSARNSDEAQKTLEAARARSERLSQLLYGLCALVAIVGSLLAAQAVRRYMLLSTKYAELQASRALELEQFSARVAHDILGPLQPVSLGLNLLEPKLPSDPKTQEVLARMQRSLGRAQLIVEGLLRFARAGARPEPGEQVSLSHVFEGLREDLLPVAEDAGVSLKLESVPDTRVACAEAALMVVLQNLIRNAIKYIGDGPRKEIITRAAIDSGTVRLLVQDSGPGLPDGLERTVFEPYVRAAGTKQPGIGLGLATVKRIAEAHHGRVGVQSRPGQGATFWVEFPLVA